MSLPDVSSLTWPCLAQFDTFEKDIIIMPINHNNAHWVCAAVNISLKRFEYYDSLGHPSAFVYDVRFSSIVSACAHS